MSLWGATDADESKPKNLTTAEKLEVSASSKGWIREAGSRLSGNGNTSATPEVLVAIGGLAVKIGAADITEITFVTTAFDKSAGGNIDVLVRFNEAVDVTGTPRVSITNGNQGSGSGRGPHLANYLSGTGTNELTFRCTIAAANAATNADDVLVIGTNATALNGGTIKDAGTTTVSTITNAAGIGTAAGSITVVA
ncbi:putative S-layer domain protein [uncultured virus]|uniref:Putative S-layer domain protein n=1 Tax=uncultured virus TaxID=340016 RepID=A0A218MMF6_9VIRU|nr:putative S-layer domain protein [uncultured virus]